MSNLKRYRMAQGLTLAELGRKCRVSAAAVYNWEAGRCEPSARVFPRLATALGLAPLDLTRVISPEVGLAPAKV